MTELIRINETEGKKTVSARELYSGLIEGAERFSKWWNRMISYGYVDGVDYKSGAYQKVQGNQYGAEKLVEDFEITIDMAKELHQKLEVKAKFADWIKRMIEYGFEENKDYVSLLKNEKRETGATHVNEDYSRVYLKVQANRYGGV